MGEVYLAEDLNLGRQVAIKTIPAGSSSNAESVDRFRREARAVSTLNHPNILTIHDYGEENGIHFFVTEHVRGKTLRHLAGQRPGVSEVLSIAVAIARGLAAAHDAGIVHRDVKPENVMVTEDGLVKILDFGLAKLFSRGNSAESEFTGTATARGLTLGTPNYMSPEQWRGDEVDGGADVFSLGVMLYELIAGRRPFKGATPQDVAASILTREPPRITRFRQIPPRLETLLKEMLQKSRKSRPAASAVALELEALRRAVEANDAASISGANAVPVMSRADRTALTQRRVAATAALVRPHNLPTETTPLVGREADVDAVMRLVRREDVRLVTITGAGGGGKTRVGLKAAEQLLEDFSDGAYLVPLDAISDPSLLGSAIAQTIGIRENAGEALEATLVEQLRSRRLLLLLDNFEQILVAGTFVATLLKSIPGLKVLATSQSPLRIRGEHEYPLDPLGLPSAHANLGELKQNPSIALFVERARQVRPDFVLTEQNAEAVAAICRSVDGLPLAIELAAVRIKLLSPDAIVRRLSDPMGFLTAGPRDLPARQQALRKTMEWSFGLLEEEEKRLFARLAVFRGCCSLEAVETVCDIEQRGGAAILDTLTALVEKSLIRHLHAEEMEPEFFILDSVRAFARQQLPADEQRVLSDRHLTYFALLAERAEAHLMGAGQAFWLRKLDADHANCRAAIDWSIESRHADAGLRLGCGIWRFWNLRGLVAEGRDRLERLLTGAEGSDPRLRMKALFAGGVLADAQGDFPSSTKYFEQALEICRVLDDRWGIANSLNNLAIAALRVGDLDSAQARHEESLRLWRSLDNQFALALSLQNLGNIERAKSMRPEARRHYEESMEIFRRAGDDRGVALSLTLLADLAGEEGDFAAARRLYEEGLQIFMRLLEHWQVANCMADFGDLMRAGADYPEAYSLLEESLLIFRELDDRKNSARVLDSLATLALDERQPERAITLAAAASAVRAAIGEVAPEQTRRIDEALREPRDHLGSPAAEDARRLGARMSFDEAVAFAQGNRSS